MNIKKLFFTFLFFVLFINVASALNIDDPYAGLSAQIWLSNFTNAEYDSLYNSCQNYLWTNADDFTCYTTSYSETMYIHVKRNGFIGTYFRNGANYGALYYSGTELSLVHELNNFLNVIGRTPLTSTGVNYYDYESHRQWISVGWHHVATACGAVSSELTWDIMSATNSRVSYYFYIFQSSPGITWYRVFNNVVQNSGTNSGGNSFRGEWNTSNLTSISHKGYFSGSGCDSREIKNFMLAIYNATNFIMVYAPDGFDLHMQEAANPNAKTLDVYVYSNNTGAPLENAYVELKDNTNTSVISSGYTDANGHIQFQALFSQDNYIYVNKGCYEAKYQLVPYYDTLSNVYLDPIPSCGGGIDSYLLSIFVYDASTGYTIENAYVQLIDLVNWQTKYDGYTGPGGQIDFYVDPNEDLSLLIIKNGYEDTTDFLFKSNSLNVVKYYFMSPSAPPVPVSNYTLDIYLYDHDTNAPIDNAYLQLSDLNGTIKYTGYSDINGYIQFQIDPNEKLLLNITKIDYEDLIAFLYEATEENITKIYFLHHISEKINFVVLDSKDKSPVVNAQIALSNATAVEARTTDNSGIAKFYWLDSGYYYNIEVYASGYQNYNDSRIVGETNYIYMNLVNISDCVSRYCINGIVLDYDTKNPIYDVLVSLLDEKKRIVKTDRTNDNNNPGFFRIDTNQTQGIYYLKFEHDAFFTKEIQIMLSNNTTTYYLYRKVPIPTVNPTPPPPPTPTPTPRPTYNITVNDTITDTYEKVITNLFGIDLSTAKLMLGLLIIFLTTLLFGGMVKGSIGFASGFLLSLAITSILGLVPYWVLFFIIFVSSLYIAKLFAGGRGAEV